MIKSKNIVNIQSYNNVKNWLKATLNYLLTRILVNKAKILNPLYKFSQENI